MKKSNWYFKWTKVIPTNEWLPVYKKNLYRYVGKIKKSPHAVIDFKKIIKDIL